MAKGVFVLHCLEKHENKYQQSGRRPRILKIISFLPFGTHFLVLSFRLLFSVSCATSIGSVFKQVTFVAYLFHRSLSDIKCFIHFSALGSQNKTAAALHLGAGDR